MAPAGEGGRPNRLVPYLVLAGAGVVGFAVAYLVTPRPPAAAPPPSDGLSRAGEIVVSLVLGAGLAAIAAAFALAFVSTCAFTSSYTTPVFKRIKARLFVGQIVLSALLLFALGLLLNAVLGVAFWVLGIQASSWIVSMVLSMVAVNVALVRLHLLAPLEPRLAARRLGAMGVPAAQVQRAQCIGISDPAESGWKKSALEDDIGLLWVEPERLLYRGDADSFEVARGRLLEVERTTLASSVSSYSGNRHIVLRFATDAGGERRVRLHVEGCWTPGRVVKATDQLADRLNAWRMQ